MQESLDPSRDIENGTNACTMDSDANCIPSRPVLSIGCGEGFPYAPNDWPLPGDKWVWKTGNRKGRGGYWRDRCLHPPKRLKKGAGFRSKRSVREYIEQKFPDANVDAFFSSFHWRIPCIEQSQTKETNKHDRKSSSSGSSSQGNFQPVLAIMPVNSVVGHGSLPTSQQLVEFPNVIHQALASAVEQLTNELMSTPLKSLGDKMGYFHDHIEWLARFKFPVEEFKQNLNSIHASYQWEIARLLEIGVELSNFQKEIFESGQRMLKLIQKGHELINERNHILSSVTGSSQI